MKPIIREQRDFINTIKIEEGSSKTLDCPFCGGTKKFTISKRDGVTIWNCYRASCGSKGAVRSGFSHTEIKDKLTGKRNAVIKRTRPLPEVVSDPRNHPVAIDYICRTNCMKAFESGLVRIRYNPADNRVMFFMNDGLGAVGRHLGDAKPKWMSYGDTSGILAVGNHSHAVVVEDAASACAVAATGTLTGVALLGTNISPLQKQQLMRFSNLTIALDKDANTVGLKLMQRMRSLVPTTIVFLPNDLKNFGASMISEILHQKNS